eukprot:2208090-Rhodomonas_salina.1
MEPKNAKNGCIFQKWTHAPSRAVGQLCLPVCLPVCVYVCVCVCRPPSLYSSPPPSSLTLWRLQCSGTIEEPAGSTIRQVSTGHGVGRYHRVRGVSTGHGVG